MRPVGHFQIDPGDPSLPGHFPGRPVVPGVVLLDAAFALILAEHPGRAVTAVPLVKFTRPVRPGQTVEVSCEASGAPRITFACAVGGHEVLRGSVTLGVRAASP